jgi:hypothetical protein
MLVTRVFVRSNLAVILAPVSNRRIAVIVPDLPGIFPDLPGIFPDLPGIFPDLPWIFPGSSRIS